MMQLTLGESFKREGQEAVEDTNAAFVKTMRLVAHNIATIRGQVTSDDLREEAKRVGLKPQHENAWGSIWRERGWRVMGYTKSWLPSNHARRIAVWEWEG